MLQDQAQCILGDYVRNRYARQPTRFGRLLLAIPLLRMIRASTVETVSYFSHKQYLKFVSSTCTPVGINRKGFVTSNFGMFLLLDYCIENERGSIGMPLCRVLINISSKSSKIVYFSQNCHFHVM